MDNEQPAESQFSLPADVPWGSFVTQPQKDVCEEANADSEGLNSVKSQTEQYSRY